MATYQDEYQNEEEENAPVQAGGPQVGTSGAATGGSASNTPETTGFVNFDRYFNTNAASAQNMADNVAQGVQGKEQQAHTALQTAQDEFAQNVANAAPTTENPAYSGPGYFGEGQDLSSAYDAMHAADSAYNALGTFGGRQALLADQNNTIANYSQGMQRFDTALMGRAGAEQFQNMQNGFQGFDKWLADATQTGQGLVDAQREEAKRIQAEQRKQRYEDSSPPRDFDREELEERRRRTPNKRLPDRTIDLDFGRIP